MNDCLNGDTHGPVHIMVGGAWLTGEDHKYFDSQPGSEFLRNPDKLLLFKILWRMGYSRCPDPGSCLQSDSLECRCKIPDEYIINFGAEKILKDSGVYYVLERFLSGKSEEDLKSILRLLEDPGYVGEMFSSASAFDPLFWPLHGSMERLLGYKRLLNYNAVQNGKNNSFDESWGYPSFDKYSGAAYLNGRCDWSDINSSRDLTLPNCTLGEHIFAKLSWRSLFDF